MRQFAGSYLDVNGNPYSPAETFASEIATSTSGVYIAGITAGVLTGDGSGWDDVFIRKYDHTGTLLWTDQLVAGGYDQVGDIAATDDGVYLVGLIAEDQALPGFTSAGLSDGFVRKYDPSGNVLWTDQFGTAAWDEAMAVAVTPDGVFVGGQIDGEITLRTYTPDGDLISSVGLGVQGDVTAIAANGQGVHLAGATFSAFPGKTNAGRSDAFVAHVDFDGTLVSADQFGTSGSDWVNGISSSDSRIVVAARTEGALPGQSFGGSWDAVVRAYDPSGSVAWTRQFGTATGTSADDVRVTNEAVYVVGTTNGALPGQTSVGGLDAFLRRYDFDGGVVSTRQFGSLGGDYGLSLSRANGALYIAGATDGQMLTSSPAGFVLQGYVIRTTTPQ